MAGRFSVEAVFSAVDQMTRPIGRMRRNVSRFSRSAEAGFRRIDRVSGRLTSGLKRVGGAFLGLGAGAAAGAATINTLTAADVRSQQLSESIGSNANDMEALAASVSGAGFEFDNVMDLIEEMNNKLGESAGLEATTPVLESLKILGLRYEEIKKLAPEEQFKTIADAALQMEDAQKAAAAADILMGGEANKLIGVLRQQGGSIDDIIGRYQALNVRTEESRRGSAAFQEQMRTASFAVSSISSEIAGLAGQALAPLLNRMTDWIAVNRELIKDRVEAFVDRLNEGLNWLITNFQDVVKWTKRVGIGLAVWFAFVGVLKSVIAVLTLFNLILLANPITLIVLGVIALIGVLISLGAWLLDVTGVADGFFDGLTIIFDGVVSAGAWMIDQVKAYLSMLGRFWMAVWDSISPIAAPVFELIADLSAWMLDKITHNLGTLSELWSLTWFALTAGPSLAFELIEAIVGTFVDVITGDWDNIGDRWSDLWDSIKNKATTVIDLIQPLIDRVMDSIRAVQSGIGFVGGLLGIGEDDEDDGPTPRGNQYGSQGSSPGAPRNRNGQAPPPLLTPQERTAREINETRTTEESVVTIRDETGRAEQERGAGRRNRLNMVRSGNL